MPEKLHSREQGAGNRAPEELWSREQGTGHRAREQGGGGVEKQGVEEALQEQGLHASYNTTFNHSAMFKNRADKVVYGPSVRSGETSGLPMRPGPPVAIGPTKTMVQPRIQTQNLTSSTDAFSGLGPDNQHKGADGNTPSGGRLQSPQHSPTHASPLSQNTPSAKLQALTTKTARAMGTVIGGAVQRGAAEASEEEGSQPSCSSSVNKPSLGIVSQPTWRSYPSRGPGPWERSLKELRSRG